MYSKEQLDGIKSTHLQTSTNPKLLTILIIFYKSYFYYIHLTAVL